MRLGQTGHGKRRKIEENLFVLSTRSPIDSQRSRKLPSSVTNARTRCRRRSDDILRSPALC
ncbi:hypothetical protein Hanom_Chr05g00438401 [Helianthus anomalus]